jgi:hypothetical protein
MMNFPTNGLALTALQRGVDRFNSFFLPGFWRKCSHPAFY